MPRGFTDEEWKLLSPLTETIHLEKGKTLFREGEEAHELYLLEKGRLVVVKRGHRIAHLVPGDWAGEIAALTESKRRTAAIQAEETSQLFKLSLVKLKESTQENPSLYYQIIASLSKLIAERLSSTSDAAVTSLERKLALAKMKASMGEFLCYLLLAISCFFYILKGIALFEIKPQESSLLTIPILLFLSLFLFMMVKKSGYPLKTYGITLRNWKSSLFASLLWTLPLMLFFILLKWLVITIVPAFQMTPLFIFQNLTQKSFGPWTWLLMTIGYIVMAPVQEMMARGCLQGSMMKFLTGKRKNLFSIILSNTIFSTLHLQLSLEVALYAFFVGCFWGWLYARQHTLVGVSASHAVFGLFAFLVLGPLSI